MLNFWINGENYYPMVHKIVEWLKRVDLMGVAIFDLCGAQFGDERWDLDRKIAESLISSYSPYILQLCKENIMRVLLHLGRLVLLWTKKECRPNRQILLLPEQL